ncbi:MAG: hypothetical protein P8020_02830 [Acidobacteriota bacterium]
MKRVWMLVLLLVSGTSQSLFGITFSQLALGGSPEHYECTILISNMSEGVWYGKMKALKGDNENWTVRWVSGDTELDTSAVQFDLAPQGTMKVTVKSIDGSLDSGYLQIMDRIVIGQPSSSTSTTDLAVGYFYNLLDQSGNIVDSISVPRSFSDVEHMLPVEYVPDKVNTAFAWSPSSAAVDEQFSLHFELMDPQGEVVATTDVPYQGQAAKFVSDLFPDVAQSGAFLGRLRITTGEIDIYTTALRLMHTTTGFQLTGTPPDRPF